MGFYFRKSFGKGAFRINLSKSGVSYSVGVKGARVRFSNKGTYVSFNSHGISYRKKISGPPAGNRTTQQYLPPALLEQHTITSGDVEQITDVDSQEFINELKEKGKKISYYKNFGVYPLAVLSIMVLYLFFSNAEIPAPEQVAETKTFIIPSGHSGVNIRKYPGTSSAIEGLLKYGDEAILLDEYAEWYKVRMNSTEGYVSKEFTQKQAQTSIQEQPAPIQLPSLYDKHPGWFWTFALIILIGSCILLPYLKKVDERRLLVEIYYDMDERIQGVYQQFTTYFASILNTSKTWQYLHAERTNDYKYSSGAAITVTRRPLTRISAHNTPSKIFRTNVEVPYLGLINTELYFFPERLIVKRGQEFGAIMYKNMNCYSAVTRFIESETLAADAQVIGHTWRYLNKNGTPDKRFANNYQLPICQYSEYSFTSASGLNEKICTSKVGAFDDFSRLIKGIGQLQEQMDRALRFTA